jgi:zinc/manganese transport system ATP-binding protein
MSANAPPAVEVIDASLRYGSRALWERLSVQVREGEFLAVLGGNGVGKTSLLRVLLGLARPSEGRVQVLGAPPQRGSPRVGYIPQQRAFDRSLPLRGRDLVALGLDGHRWGPGVPSRVRRERLGEALAAVEAEPYADTPLGLLSGGEQQRLRVAQAIVSRPALLLCDEPLLSLDLAHQGVVVAVLDRLRREHGTTVVFVTHDVNPILTLADRVLYFAGQTWAVGPPDEVLTSDTLTRLYGSPVDVLRVRDRVVVVGTPAETEVVEAGVAQVHHPDPVQGADE